METVDFNFTLEQVEGILHRDDAHEWYDAMVEILPKYQIDTPKRVAGFIAQTAHESASYKTITENLNYSAKALDAIFGKYFKRAARDSEPYHRQPEKIANVVYANRMDNGDTDSGDGWKYRGRGPIQLTGKKNYSSFAEDMDVDVVDNPDMVSEDKEVALMSAIWYWNKNGLNRYADSGDIKTMTKRINGGYIGLEDRIHHWKEALHMLGSEAGEHDSFASPSDDPAPSPEDIGVLRKGMKSVGVAMMQEALGIASDGNFGPGTEQALKLWQRYNGLVADGIAGPATLGELLG